MQVTVQVRCKSGPSLRQIICKDPKIEKYGLLVSKIKTTGRKNGWSKIHGVKMAGVINMNWASSIETLVCRIVTKGGSSNKILGHFLKYLYLRHGKKIEAMTVN